LNKIKDGNLEFHFVGAIPESKQLKDSHLHYGEASGDSSKLKTF